MFIKIRENRSRAQSTAEYAIVIALVIGAVIGMQTMIKRHWQGRVKILSDNLVTNSAVGEDPGIGTQYEYGDTTVALGTKQVASQEETIKGSSINRTDVFEQTNRTGSQGYDYTGE